MTKNNSILEVFKTEFAELSAKLNGSTNSAGHLSRISALEAVSKTGLPNRKNEEYRYTPLSQALEKDFVGFSQEENSTSALGKNELPAVDGSSLVFINGVYSDELSSIVASHANNITITKSQKELLKEEKSEPVSDSYSNLNLALAATGVKINVEKNAILESPVNIIHIANTAAGRAIATVRHEIVIGENSQATVSEFFIGDGVHSSFTNSVVESVIHKNGILNHYKLGLDGKNDLRVDNTTCHQHGNSVFNTNNLNFGGKIIRNNLTIVLDGEYCESNLDGLYIPIANGTIDNHSVVDHRLPNSNSNELYKGIMTDNSTGVFNGKVFVRPDAQKTNAFQSNKNILMADTATINTKPQLEIWADDVKCSHGCTTGQLDREQLFYLRARGIDEMNARKLLLKAFAEEVIDRVNDEGIKAIAEAALDKKLG